MNIRQIRNASVIVTYAGKKFLVDPWLAEKGSLPPVSRTLNQDKRNPLVDLPLPLEDIIRVDAVVVTHLHFDHFDGSARRVLPKNLPMFAQDEEDAGRLRHFGFENVTALRDGGVEFKGVTLHRTRCEHGQGENVARYYRLAKVSSRACGVVFAHPEEKTLYVAGDTVWCPAVREAIEAHHPEVVILNAGHAQYEDGSPIIMGARDVREVCWAALAAAVIASHMEAVNHALLTRAALRAFTEEQGIAQRVLIPADGEAYVF